MKKNMFFILGVPIVVLVFALLLAGCPNDSATPAPAPQPSPPATGNGTVNLTNQHSTDTIYWFEMKNSGIVTIGEAVSIAPYFAKQFQVPPGIYIAGVTAGGNSDLRQTTVTISSGQTVNLVYNGGLSQQ